MTQNALNLLARQFSRRHLRRRQLAQQSLLFRICLGVYAHGERFAQFIGQCTVSLARVATGTGSHFRCQQGRNQTVLVSAPNAAILTQERCTGALFTAKTQRAVEQTVGEPFEADRHFVQTTTQTLGHAIDQATADHGFTHASIGAPLRTVLEQVIDGHGEVIVRRQQTTGRRDDAVAVVIRVAGESHVETLFQTDQTLHRMARRWVHANLTIPVDGHETESRIDLFVDHFQIQTIVLGNRRPIAHPCSAQRIHAQTQFGVTNGVEVDHVDQVGDVGVEVIMAVRGAGLERLLVADALHARQFVRQQLVGLGFDPLGDVGIGRAAVGWVVFVAAALWRVVRWRNNHAVRQASSTATVIAKNRVGNGWRWCVFITFSDHDGHAVGR